MYGVHYYQIIKKSKDSFFLREQLVKYALENSIKAAAREFKTTPKTVRKWVRRFNENKKTGLRELSRRPHNSPNKTDGLLRAKIVRITKELKSNNKRIIPALIKRKNNISCSLPTVIKILREEGLYKKSRRKYQRKRDLREYKKKYKPFEKIQIDVKYLDDIPEMYREYVRYKLPKYQFTARCMCTGALFIAYGQEKSMLNASIFIILLLEHLKKYNVDLRETRIQTDNGTEFTTPWNSIKDSIFTIILEKYEHLIHRRIPPGAKTWQSDVETSHRIIEDEFYSYELIHSYNDFFKKAEKYVSFFNSKRFNTYKNATPKELLEKFSPEIDENILYFKPVLLDNFIEKYENYMRSARA